MPNSTRSLSLDTRLPASIQDTLRERVSAATNLLTGKWNNLKMPVSYICSDLLVLELKEAHNSIKTIP